MADNQYLKETVIKACQATLEQAKKRYDITKSTYDVLIAQDNKDIQDYIKKHTRKMFIFFGPIIKPSERDAKTELFWYGNRWLSGMERHRYDKIRLDILDSTVKYIESILDKCTAIYHHFIWLSDDEFNLIKDEFLKIK